MAAMPTAPPKPQLYPPPLAPQPPADKGAIVAGVPVVMGAAKNNNPQPPPPPLPPQQQLEAGQLAQFSSWSTGLCDCFSDMHSCCLVFWCPCIAFGRMAEIVDKGTSSCCACGSLYMFLVSVGLASTIASATLASSSVGAVPSFQWILSCVYRSKLKQTFNIRPSCLEDCCTHFWCEPCALCQEYRELQNRGYDLSLGWEGNSKKQNAASTKSREVTAPVAPCMDR